MSIIIKRYFVIKTLNSFNFNFFIYVTIINEKTRNEKKFSKLKNLIKHLKNEKNRMKKNDNINMTRANQNFDDKNRENTRDDRDDNNVKNDENDNEQND